MGCILMENIIQYTTFNIFSFVLNNLMNMLSETALACRRARRKWSSLKLVILSLYIILLTLFVFVLKSLDRNKTVL